MNKLVKFDPFAELNALQRQFFGDDFFTSPLRSSGAPTTDVYTNDDKELIVEAHLPNYDQNDIDIHMENGALVISAEKHEKEEDKKKKYVVRESASSFYRRISLPERADEDNIQAHMNNGVLKVTVPFKELPAPKKIAINAKNKA
jgi:HSP20 family protein